ncbi:MAG: hypothetical protein AAGC47_13535 [Bacteroidota bacterium]
MNLEFIERLLAFRRVLLQLLFLLGVLTACGQHNTDRINIILPSIQDEATSIWRTINDYSFLESQGYNIRLPENEQIDSLILLSKNGHFGNDQFPVIYGLLENGVYNENEYASAMKKAQAQEELINSIVDVLFEESENWAWGFKTFPEYKVTFTLYGTGGSYDPDNGIVTLWTNVKGDFMQYDKPANTAIHEIVHMGIEEWIVQKYGLDHGTKERLVDIFVFLLFEKSLPEYRIQNMGNAEMDKHLKTKVDLHRLDEIAAKLK